MIRQVINGVRFLVTGCFSSSQKVHPVEPGLMRVNLSPGGMYGGMYYYVSPVSGEQSAAADASSDSMRADADMEECVSSPEEEDKIKAEQKEDGSPATDKISEDSDHCGDEFVLDEGEKDKAGPEGAPEINEVSKDSFDFRERDAFVLDEEGNLIEPGRDEISECRRAADFVLPDDSNVFYAPNAPVLGVPRAEIGRQDARMSFSEDDWNPFDDDEDDWNIFDDDEDSTVLVTPMGGDSKSEDGLSSVGTEGLEDILLAGEASD